MAIDIQTAAIISIIVYGFLFVVTLMYASVVKQYRGVHYWAFWNILVAAGITLWLLRGPVPLWSSIVFGNTLQVFAGCVNDFLAGVRVTSASKTAVKRLLHQQLESDICPSSMPCRMRRPQYR